MDERPTAPPSSAPVPTAVAFPGQGVDPRDVADCLLAAADHPLVGRLGRLTGRDRWDDADLLDTRLAQPAVFVAAVTSALRHGTRWDAAIGHSLGELAAATVAGALDQDAAFELVSLRAQLGHEVQQRRPGRMVVVMRLDDAAVEWVRRGAVARAGGVLEVAVRNGPGQLVLSGDTATADCALELIDELGGVGRPLPIGGAYHSPLLVGATPTFADAVRQVARAPEIPLVSSTLARPVSSAEDVATALSRALVLPVRWVEAIDCLRDLGIGRVVDAGPGRTLANLTRHAPLLPTVALHDGR